MSDHRVEQVSVGPYDNNVYVISSAGHALIVDGAAEPERILELVEGLEVRAIVQTHDHADHTQALPALVEALSCPVYANPLDPMPVATRALADGDEVAIGDARLHVWHTPGHTPGSTCYLIGGDLFTGDTLFPGGPGNTDGDPERFAQIMRSLDRIFGSLPDGTVVRPGHGASTTIGAERPFVEQWRARGW